MPIHLMEGGGTRFKVLEAFAAGIPVVSTLKGVEGIEAAAGEHYLRAETVGEFVAAITKVCASQELRTRLAGRARTLVEESYAAGSMQAAIRAALAALGEFPRAAA
jgi:glycosyltransferase involved in cell wall biosynthesis